MKKTTYHKAPKELCNKKTEPTINLSFILKTSILLCLLLFLTNSFSQEKNKTNSYLEKAMLLKYTNTDSSIYYYKKSITLNYEKKDTLNVINNLLDLSFLYGHILDYSNSYEGYWEALYLADKSKDDYSKAKIYQALGWLYSFYDRDKEALQYFNNSLKLTKNNKKKTKLKNQELLLQGYFSILNFYRIKGNKRKIKIYLDSCYVTQKKVNPKNRGFYVESEAGYYDAINKKYDSGLAKLQEARAYFETKDPSYLIIINFLIGDVYRMKGDLTNSNLYFKHSLDYSLKYRSHANYKIITHEAMAHNYATMGDYKNAYNHSNLAKEYNTKVFGKNSKNSQQLFEINDKFRMQKEKEAENKRLQHLKELEHEESVWFLKSILYTIVILSLLIYGFLYIKNIRAKHKSEKKVLAEKQEIELNKNKEILELKNKELTSSALQLIEKDEFIEQFKHNLADHKNDIDAKTIDKMIKTIQGSPSSNWKEFEARFTAVNQSFYTNLKDQYPDLGQTDLKICALIKLNFSSKDMASLLGISYESVHTSRYRLRKKFKLDRNNNLNDFIASI